MKTPDMTRTHRHGRRRRKLSWPGALLVAFAALLALLIVAARFLPKSGASAEIQAILDTARQDQAARAAAVERAKKQLPSDAIVRADWDFRPILRAFQGGRLDPLMTLVSGYVHHGEPLPEADLDEIRRTLRHKRPASPGDPFYFPIHFEDLTGSELVPRLCEFLNQSKPLRELEAARSYGLLDAIADAYRNPLESGLVNINVLIAGRAACELQAGDAQRALDSLCSGYALASLLADWAHPYGPSNRYYADRILDCVLWRVVDAAPLDAANQDRIVSLLDSRKPADRLEKMLLVYAARLEIGEESDHRGYPKPFDVAFAFTGRGALASARQLVAVLDKPPYETRDVQKAVSAHRAAGYWVNRFVDSAVGDYRTHALESMMGDIARLVFALKAWRRDHGAYPATCDALKPFPLPSFPKDPIHGAPIVYETDGQSFTLSGAPDEAMWKEQYWIAWN